jgi:hypothetical protein
MIKALASTVLALAYEYLYYQEFVLGLRSHIIYGEVK